MRTTGCLRIRYARGGRAEADQWGSVSGGGRDNARTCVTRTAAFPLEQIASVASGAEAAGRGTGTPLVLPLRQHRKSSATLFTPTPALAEDLRSGHLPPL